MLLHKQFIVRLHRYRQNVKNFILNINFSFEGPTNRSSFINRSIIERYSELKKKRSHSRPWLVPVTIFTNRGKSPSPSRIILFIMLLISEPAQLWCGRLAWCACDALPRPPLFYLNHLRWQLIADHNEWPNRIQ